jgi:autotransporter translocation and assembly factor TamB
MESKEPSKAPPAKTARPRWRVWLRRIGLGFLVLLAILILFHRPIIFEGTRYFVVRAAKQQNLDITYDISGSIFSTLSISKLKGVPTEPGPIQRLEIGNINLRYSLWGLIRKGMPALLKVVEIQNVHVEITPAEEPPPEKADEPQKLKFPAFFPELLNLENVNFVSHAKGGDTVLEGLYFSLLPDRPGVLKIKTLDIPGVRRWEGIAGATTFRDRNLLLTDLVIGPEIALRRFNLDASKLDDSILGVGLDGELFGAATTLTLRVSDVNATNHLVLDASCAGLNFDAAWKYLNLDVPLHGTLASLTARFEGEPEAPQGWTGKVALGLAGITVQAQALGDLAATVDLGGGRAKLTFTDQLDPKNSVRLAADVALPAKLDGFARTSGTGKLEVLAPDLGLLTRTLAQPVLGDASVVTDFQLNDGKLATDTTIDSARISASGAELLKTHFTVRAEKDLTVKSSEPVFVGLSTRLEGGVATIRAQGYEADAFAVLLSTRDADVNVENLSLANGKNTVRLAARYTLPADLKSWEAQPLKLDVAIAAPELQAFAAGASLKGALEVAGTVSAQDRVFEGDLQITGRDIESQGLRARSIAGRVQIVKNLARFAPFDVVIDDRNALHASGDFQLDAPYAYHGTLDVRLADLSRFQSLVGRGKDAPKVAGSLVANWQGSGDAKTPRHVGAATVTLTGGQFGEQRNLSANIKADYSPEYINVPDLRVAAGTQGNAALSLFWQNDRLRVTNLAVRQQRLTLLEGSVELPLVLAQYQDVNRLLPNDQPMSVSLRTRALNLRTLFAQLGQQKPPMTGTVDFTLDASGTLDTLAATANVRGTRLQSTAAAGFDPADVTFDATLRNKRLGLNGTVRQRLIQPLQITGALPLDVVAIKRTGALDPNTPLDASVRLPRSSLAFVGSLVPAIRQIRGTAAVDVLARGTISRPVITGSIASDLETLRFTDPTLPPISRFGLRIGFTQDRLRIEQCRGAIAGGSFGASGDIGFAQSDNPVFNLRLVSQNALVMQNDDLTVRVSTDVRVTGPLKAGVVSGNVFVTKSRFFKDIDILPIGLPGRPAPQPPPEPSVVSFPNPPLRDWKFDVAIRTSDPFLVQSNLANGRITMNLRVGGTGLAPWMDGSVRIEQLLASLPFSRLEITNGTVFFTQADPFEPQLNLRGTSTIREYDVSVFIYGPASNPQAVFSSDPPLPQSEVVSLIATGTTTEELGRDPNALAGRAAVLAFQKLYRSMFRRNRPPEQNDSFLSRIQFDIGSTDPKTGKQAAQARIPLAENFALVGGLDVGGNFRGQVKYLLRFK